MRFKQKIAHKHACEYTNCDKTYRHSSQLQDHVNYVHLKIYNYVCDRVDENGIKCEYKCEQAIQLKVHKDGKHDKIKNTNALTVKKNSV